MVSGYVTQTNIFIIKFEFLCKDKKVLIIGAGPSGIDLTFDISKTANLVGISHHSTILTDIFPSNVTQLKDVKEVDQDGNVVFSDETVKSFDAIIYCTGYHYGYPFLSPECGIKVINHRHVTPLYKHVINIEHPTMFFIGVVNVTIFTHVTELQVRLTTIV